MSNERKKKWENIQLPHLNAISILSRFSFNSSVDTIKIVWWVLHSKMIMVENVKFYFMVMDECFRKIQSQ